MTRTTYDFDVVSGPSTPRQLPRSAEVPRNAEVEKPLPDPEATSHRVLAAKL